MNKLVLIGGGGHCKSVLDAAIRSGEYSDIVITDPMLETGTTILTRPVVGNDDMLPELLKQGYAYAFITVGSILETSIRETLVKKAKALGFHFPVIKDPSATISDFSRIEEGTFIGKNATVNAGVSIGKHCIINTGAILEHECIIGDFSHVSVGTALCGGVQIGKRSFVGAGTTVIQGISIGPNVLVGAGSTVLTNVGDNMKVYGIVTNRGGIA